MSVTVLTAILVLALAAGLFILRAIPAVQSLFRYRGQRLVTCPETHKPEAVNVDTKEAALGAFLSEPTLHLNRCSRWPERQDCAQQCIREIETSPFGCALRAMLDNWYKGKECIYCHCVFDEILWFDHKPALQSPDGHIVEWKDIRPEAIPDVLRTHQPVCWNCSIVENFRTERPDLVTDRHR